MELIEPTSDDLTALVDRWYSLAEQMATYDELNELAYSSVTDVPDDGFRDHLDDRITDFLIQDEDETIGFLTLREDSHPSRAYSQYVSIVNLAIDEEHRNRGHGTAVLERVKELASDWECDHLKVACNWHNEDARRFYLDTGFRPKQIEYAQPID